MTKRCPYCHEEVSVLSYPVHVARHERLREDGQQEEHVTLPPEERVAGDLSDVPRVYHHAKCGVQTVMPEEIVRSYLVNPFLYGGGTFCCGCNSYVPFSAVTWVETGQTLEDYFRDLQQQAIKEGRVPPSPSAFWPIALLVLLFGAVGSGALAQRMGAHGGLGALIGGSIAAAGVLVAWLIVRMLKKPQP